MDLLSLHARRPDRYPALFESAAPGGTGRGDNGRYDILFGFPQQVLWKDRAGLVHGSASRRTRRSFFDSLDAAHGCMAQSIVTEREPLPFTGGWMIFLGYEMAAEAEPSLRLPSSPQDVLAFALRIPAAIIFDRLEKRVRFLTEPGCEAMADIMARDLQETSQNHSQPAPIDLLSLEEEDPARFLDAVRRAQEYIADGHIYQANLSRLWRARVGGGLTPAQLYRHLRRANPAPFAACCVWQDLAIISSSPERLCALRDGEISTRPIAGTRRRSGRPGADVTETSGLIAHPKERAEHVMLIDLERNDLGRICEPGTVRVDEFMGLESYQYVHHIVSNVRGRLRPEVTPGEVLRAVFPGGTVTGCPKVRCMKIIAELEGQGRGAYTGSLGYLNHDGSGDFNILIRTMAMQGGQLEFRAGAGIVADSHPERELAETCAKAEGLLRALRAPE